MESLSCLRGYPYEMFNRRYDASSFKSIRRKCPSGSGSGSGLEKKFFISGRDGSLVEWDDDLYGVTRVLIHGVDSICVVARKEDLENVTCHAEKVCNFMSDILPRNAFIFEAEDLTLPPGDVSKMTCQVFKKPFAVVSVTPGPNSGHEASSNEYHVNSAIKFLREKICIGTTFTLVESVKTAIETRRRLFGQKLNANEIKVFYVKDYKSRVLGESILGEPAKVIPMRSKSTLKDHLAVIKKLPRSGGTNM